MIILPHRSRNDGPKSSPDGGLGGASFDMTQKTEGTVRLAAGTDEMSSFLGFLGFGLLKV